MAYNINYTTLPTFTSNSIGNLSAYQIYENSFSSSTSTPVFSVSVSPGIYLFTAAVGIPLAAADSIQLTFNLQNSASGVYCQYDNQMTNGDGGSSHTMTGSLSQAFYLTDADTLSFYITSYDISNGFISYALVRLA